MTVSTAYAPLLYSGNGATTVFSVTWPFFASSSLVVTAIDADGVETVKTLTTHYTVTGGTGATGLPAAGNVTMLVAPASGTQLRITRVTPKTQTATWGENDNFPQATVEAAIDKNLMLIQEGLQAAVDEITGDFLQLDSSGAVDFWDGQSHPILDVGESTDSNAAATYGQLSEAVLDAGSWLGSAGATDNRLLRSDGTGGATIQNSPATLDDDGNLSGVTNLMGLVNLSQTGYHDYAEISAPSSPSANTLRLYAKDNGSGLTYLYFKDSAGTETQIGSAGGTIVASIAALKALSTASNTRAFLSLSGRAGYFTFRSGNYAADVTADTQNGVYVKADDTASASGAWVRDGVDGFYDVKWFGAVGDITTNDYTAVQAAIDFAEYKLGGTVWFSPGGYTVNTGLTVEAALVSLAGPGKKYASIRSLVANINLVTISAARCSIENLSLFNQVRPSSSSAIIRLASGAVQGTYRDLDVVGGYYCFTALSGSADNVVENCVMRLAWGTAITYCVGAGTVFFDRCLFNQDWPAGTPAPSNDKGNHATSTAYSLKDFVVRSGLILQCTTAGTSAGTAPDVSASYYSAPITDGTVTWYVANVVNAAPAVVDTGCIYIDFQGCDFTGSFDYGVVLANTLGGDRPDVIRVMNCTTAGIRYHGIHVLAADRITIKGNEIQGPVAASSRRGINLSSGFPGDAQIIENSIISGFDIGIALDYSTTLGTALVQGNEIFGLTKAIAVSADVDDFQIVNNNVGASDVWGANTTAIEVATGASDNYIIVGNRVAGATNKIVDSGTGVNKSVMGNGQSSAFSAHKNGTDQTGIADITFTQITFGSENYDRGGNFASNAWTPPAGPVAMSAAAFLSGTWSAGALIAISIYKNGSPLRQANWYAPAANTGSAFIACDDNASGTDVYTVRIYVDVSSGTATVSGSAANTYFSGHSVGA